MNDQHRMSPIKDSSAENAAVVHAIAIPIIMLFSTAIGYLLALPFRYGYGKHFLWALFFLFFVAPVVATVAILAMGVHAHPEAAIHGWQVLVAQHPGAASWTWAFKDFVDICRW